MKKLVFAFLFLSYFSAQAQENIVKAGLSLGNVGVMYERSLSNHFSAAAQVGFGFATISEGNNSDIATGTGFMIEGRYYFSNKKGKMQGWHVGPGYQQVNTKLDNNKFSQEKYNISVYSLNTGSQWIYKSHITFEFNLGIGYQELTNSNQSNDTPVALLLGVGVGYAF